MKITKYLKKNFFSKSLLFFSILLLVYVFFKSEFIHNGDARAYYVKYYIISFIIILFSILTFFISKEIKKNLLLLIFSVYISFVFIEIILFYTFQKDYHESLKYVYLKKKNPETYLKIYPSFFVKNNNYSFIPLSGMSNKQIVVCKETNKVSTFNSDRYGFNNPDKEWDGDIVEMFMIGDSFLHGNCVDENDIISSNFRKFSKKEKNDRFSIINTGQPASGPLIQLAILREYLPKNKNIKKLIWFYYEQNDLNNLKRELKNPILLNYFNNQNYSQNLSDLNINKKKDMIVKKFHDELVKNIENYIFKNFGMKLGLKGLIANVMKLSNIRRLTIENNKIINLSIIKNLVKDKNALNKIIYPEKPKLEEFEFKADENLLLKFKKIAGEIKKIANEKNIETYFVYIPSLYRIENNMNYKFMDKNKDQVYSASDNIFAYSKVKTIINNLGFKIIDLQSDFFSKQKNPENFFAKRYRSHFTVDGYKKISMFIYDNISSNN